jgi:hypothetical protein
MAKVFTIKKHRLRARARRRTHALKIDAPAKGLKTTQEMKNYEVIESIMAKMKAQA